MQIEDEREIGATERDKKKRVRQSESEQEHATRHQETKQVSWLRTQTQLHNISVYCEAEHPFAGRLLFLSVTRMIQLWPDVNYICTYMRVWMLLVRQRCK